MNQSVDAIMRDILFKETLASESNRELLEYLLEQLLEFPEHSLRGKLNVKYESLLKKGSIRDKNVRADILIEFDNTIVDIEAYTYFNKKSLMKSFYYLIRMQSGNLEMGDDYEKLKNSFQINFVDHVHTSLDEHPLTRYYLTSEHDINKKIFKNKFCFIVVRIDKIRELNYNLTGVLKLFKFLSLTRQEERNELAKGDELLMKLNSWIYENISDKKTIQDLEKIAQDIQDEQYYLAGKNDGIIQEKREIAKNLFKMNMSLEDISKATGLTIEEIKKLKEE